MLKYYEGPKMTIKHIQITTSLAIDLEQFRAQRFPRMSQGEFFESVLIKGFSNLDVEVTNSIRARDVIDGGAIRAARKQAQSIVKSGQGGVDHSQFGGMHVI